MNKTHAVGIDLGTTYSCIAWLNEHGQPVTIPNHEGELSTPSVVFFENESPIVGTEALRNAIARPGQVVQNVKRFMGHSAKSWEIQGKRYTPVYISGLILRKLISAAEAQLGKITKAVVTVPAQFSEAQRHATIQAGHAAGLKHVEIINEPVAAALCHVLGSEGIAFAELAIDQQLLVYDLGGGTLDLALVKYAEDEVRVVASDGDLELGGLDWTQTIVDIAAERFMEEFQQDPRLDPESHQFLALEAEQAKRSLSVRPRAAVTVQHDGNRKTYQVEQQEFQQRCQRLLSRSKAITRRILSDNGFGWAHVDEVLTTGGSSRMPMVRESLKKLSGRTLNSSLSPDQSIAHGAAYYAGMLLSNQADARTVFNTEASSRLKGVKQQSVNARGLGILVRNVESEKRVAHYLIPPNTPLPASKTHVFGTVVGRQTRVHVRIVESGAGPGKAHTILGDCLITDLPPNLPEGSEVEVTISYDREAKVHVTAHELKSGKRAETEIIRAENLAAQLQENQTAKKQPVSKQVTSKRVVDKQTAKKQDAEAAETVVDIPAIDLQVSSPPPIPKPVNVKKPPANPEDEWTLSDEWELVSERLADFSDFYFDPEIDEAVDPVPLCKRCGQAVDITGACSACDWKAQNRGAKKLSPKRGKTQK